MRAMGSANASLYVIDPVGLGVAPGPFFGGDSGFANETGGYAFVNTNDFRGAADRIWQESSSYYMLGVVRSAGPAHRATSAEVEGARC